MFSPTNRNATTVIPVPEKVFTMDIHEHTLIVGMANRLNYVFDVRKMDEPIQRRDSSLKFMTRCIKMAPTGDGTPTPRPFPLPASPSSQPPVSHVLYRVSLFWLCELTCC